MESERPDRSSAFIVFVVLAAFVVACGGIAALVEILEGNLF